MKEPLVVDPRQIIRFAYAFLLDREPEDEQTIDMQLREVGAETAALRRRIIGSPEFVNVMASAGLNVTSRSTSVGPLDGMLGDLPIGKDGYFVDRFGVKTRVSYLPKSYHTYSGRVGSADGRFDMPVHEPEEMNALLRSVYDSKVQFVALELGAGWGPWIVLGGHLARRRGLSMILTGVEGSFEHVKFMEAHMTDNDFDPSTHRVMHAIVGTYDGIAAFPKLPDPSSDWGAEARFDVRQVAMEGLDQVACVSLATILDGMPIVDFLHCDIQGAEAEVFDAAIKQVNQRVRRTCIGTHSRLIEARLILLLSAAGWHLEYEHPCQFVQKGTEMVVTADGVQVWYNTRLK